MRRFTQDTKKAIRRWIGYGWEPRIIQKLLRRYYGIELSKGKIQWLINRRKKRKK